MSSKFHTFHLSVPVSADVLDLIEKTVRLDVAQVSSKSFNLYGANAQAMRDTKVLLAENGIAVEEVSHSDAPAPKLSESHHNAKNISLADAVDSFMYYVGLDRNKVASAVAKHVQEHAVSHAAVGKFAVSLSVLSKWLHQNGHMTLKIAASKIQTSPRKPRSSFGKR